jgi:NaMN:DMB phosphoribosyltransferase
MGDPVLAVAAGFACGALESGTAVTLAGGTQMLTVAALLRHDGVEDRPSLATTRFVAEDGSANLSELAATLGVSVTATDPGFEALDHPAAAGYLAGEAKEGVGMGGTLALARRRGVSMETVRAHVVEVADRVAAEQEGLA